MEAAALGRTRAQHLGQVFAGRRRLWSWRRHRLCLRLDERPVAAQQQAHRHHAADGAQHSASGADPAGHPVVRHRRIGKTVSGRARRVLPDLSQHAARHPHGRSAVDRDGADLRHDRWRIVPAGDLSGRVAVDFCRRALRARHHVADADRGGNHRGFVGPWLHGDAGARIHADRRRRAQHPDLRLARQTGRQRLARTGTIDAVLASRLPETLRVQMQEALRFLPQDAEPVDRVDFVERARLLWRGSEVSRGLPLTIRGLRKSFGDNEVLRGIDLHIPAGQFVAIVGRSGCGKSTLLRLIAGLEAIDAGTISFAEEARPEDVRVMFQEPRLLPWARVLSNVEVGLGRDRASSDAQARAEKALAEVGLDDKRGQWPAVLSGGQKQRVALARALVSDPRVLAFDEPLGALDALTRISMQQLLERVWHDQAFTAILVTHDVSEAVALADRVLVIEHGRIAHDVNVDIPRPRRRGSADLAETEGSILNNLLEGADDTSDL